MSKFIELRVIGEKSELKDFIRLCKVIQRLSITGSCRTIKVTVDGDGSGRLAFYGIEGANEEGKTLIPFNSEGIDVDNEEMLDIWIGE